MRFHSDVLLIAGKQWYYTGKDLVQYSQVCKGEPYRQESIFLSTIYLHDKNSPYKSPQSGTSIRMQSPKSKGIVTLCLSLTNAHRFAILTLKTANTVLHKANQSLFFWNNMHFIPYNQFIICTFATYRKELRITLKQTWHSASGINNLKKTHYTKEGI